MRQNNTERKNKQLSRAQIQTNPDIFQGDKFALNIKSDGSCNRIDPSAVEPNDLDLSRKFVGTDGCYNTEVNTSFSN